MSDGSVIVNRSFNFNNRLQQLHFIRKFYLTIGHVATRGQFILPSSIRADSIEMSTGRFINSLREIRRQNPPEQFEDIEKVINRSNEVLAKARTIFPLTIFPDTIILDRTKLTVIRRTFFFSEDVMSIRIEDILNITATVGPFFGSVTIATRVLSSDDHFTIKNFLREDAMHLKHMIQGYVIARHNNIACDHLTHDELIHTLQELGHETHYLHNKAFMASQPQIKPPTR